MRPAGWMGVHVCGRTGAHHMQTNHHKRVKGRRSKGTKGRGIGNNCVCFSSGKKCSLGPNISASFPDSPPPPPSFSILQAQKRASKSEKLETGAKLSSLLYSSRETLASSQGPPSISALPHKKEKKFSNGEVKFGCLVT